MDITTTYLGMELRSPLVPSACPWTGELGKIKQLEDAGAAAVVLPSLFQEQLSYERLELQHFLTQGTESYAEALSYFPQPEEFVLGPDLYLDLIQNAKASCGIPIIASLNGKAIGDWTEFAQKIEQAGADALELNIYHIPTDPTLTSSEVDQTYIDIVRAVKSSVSIPIAVKLSPFFSSMANVATRLDEAGADALVLFNRFYQADIDLDNLEVTPNVLLSTPQAMRLPLTWIGILYGRVGCDLAATSGIHSHEDVLKMLMAGASITQMASVLLRNGAGALKKIEQDLVGWMEEHEYESVNQMRGSMSRQHSPDPSAYERAQYIKGVRYDPSRWMG